MKVHYFLAVTVMGTLANHVRNQRSDSHWYLAGAVVLWVVLSVAATVHAVLIKRHWGYPWPRVKATSFLGLLHIDLTVPIHWNIQPGQYVYIWLPHAGLPARLQLALFYVVFWDDKDKQRILHVLTRPQASSLTGQLYAKRSMHGAEHKALVFGPYGKPFDFPMAGTILFIVEDIGVMRVLPLICMLVQASEQRQAMVRKMEIVWQMDDFGTWWSRAYSYRYPEHPPRY